jgi:hypothetical protein
MRAGASELRRLRLRAQALSGERPASPTDAARRLLAVQAQDLPAARWALGVRTRGARDQELADALADGALVRHWPLRGTLQLVAREDLRWLLALTAERQWDASTRIREVQWGVDRASLETARQASVAALSGGRSLTRAELAAAIEAVGVAMTGGRGYQVIYALAITGTLVWAEPHGAGQRLALLDERVPADEAPLGRDEALARLVRRYLAGHGPATIGDLAWWAGVPIAWVRRGADAAGIRVEERDGLGYLWSDEFDAPAAAARELLLLPAFDEYLLGYQRRELVLDPEHAGRVAPQSNGRFLPLVVSAGRIVGTWRAGRDGVAAEAFDEATALSPAALERAVRRLRRFQGGGLA